MTLQDNLRDYFFIDYPIKAVASFTGWIGIISRIVAAIALIVIISGMTWIVYKAIFGTILAYIILTILPNLSYIWGIYMEHKPYMFPYLVVVPVEIALIFVISISLTILMYAAMILDVSSVVLYIFLWIILLGMHYALWFCSILLYTKIEGDESVKYNHRDHFSMYNMR